MINFSVPSTLPLSNIDVEVSLLGSILLDPEVIYIVANMLPVEAFTLLSHKKIYQVAVDLYKQQQPVNLLTVTSCLADRGILKDIGGREKLAMLLDSCPSAANADHYAELLIEKHIRRQLSKLSAEIDEKAHETDNPLSWTLENIEQSLLSITQLRNAKSKGYWQKIDDIAFERLCKELEDIEEIENAAQRDWAMRKLSKKWKFSNKKELLDFHAKWLDSKDGAQTYSAKDYFEKYGQSEQDWLIPGFVPAESVIVLYADGGVGKTRLAFTLAKNAVTGGTFAYEGTEFAPMNTLLIETDQGPRVTCKLLEMQDFLEDDCSQRLTICDDWSVGEFGKLKSMLKQHKPKLVIIDSLTSISVSSLYSEVEAEYARPLVRLRHIGKEFNCSFLVIHHSNAQGDMRGSRAIRNTVDEVWKFTKTQNELGQFNVLEIDKTRSRGPGKYKFTYDDESWGWKFGGRLEDDVLGTGTSSANGMTACIRFLTQNKGIPYESSEIATALNLNRDSVRRDLKRATSEGLVNSGRSKTNRRALVYYLGTRSELLSNITTDQTDQTDQTQLISCNSSSQSDRPLTDQLINENLFFLVAENEKNVDQFDQLITSSCNEVTATNPTDQLELITSDQLISSEQKTDQSSDQVDQLIYSLTIPEEDKSAKLKSQSAQQQIQSPSSRGFQKQQPWKPQMYKDAMYGGVLVKVVGGGQGKWQIEFSPGVFMDVRANKLSEPKSKL